ncbi:hypothetical protein CPB97_004994, partial [Podila verticillata]
IINIWKQEEWLYWTEDTAMAAMEMGLEMISKELDKLTHDDSLWFSSNSVTLKRINSFSFTRLSRTFSKMAPLCSKVLTMLAGANTTSTRRPEIVVPVIMSMLLIMCSSKSNYLQKVLSLYLGSVGTPRRVIELLAQAGVSISYPLLLKSLESLVEDTVQQARLLALHKPFYVVYDNINRMVRKSNQRLNNNDTFLNRASATVIACGDYLDAEKEPNPS